MWALLWGISNVLLWWTRLAELYKGPRKEAIKHKEHKDLQALVAWALWVPHSIFVFHVLLCPLLTQPLYQNRLQILRALMLWREAGACTEGNGVFQRDESSEQRFFHEFCDCIENLRFQPHESLQRVFSFMVLIISACLPYAEMDLDTSVLN